MRAACTACPQRRHVARLDGRGRTPDEAPSHCDGGSGARRNNGRDRTRAGLQRRVLAIVITLLVLELDPPSEPGAMPHELLEQWPGYLGYLASFGYIAVIWVNHHELFTRIRAVDAGLLWRNLLLLLTTSFLPLPTAVHSTAFQHGTRADQVAALLLYCALAAAMGTSWLALFHHLCHRPRLLVAGTPPEFSAAERRRSLVGIAAYAVAAGSAAWQPLLGLGVVAALPVFYAVTSRDGPVADQLPERTRTCSQTTDCRGPFSLVIDRFDTSRPPRDPCPPS
ncbi:TMEM175 family protein [Blastococcus sp. MG754427]|uniref:TMEM175 family protein n=1 Tax=Blastococcus sp. MG754427 TaxID=2570318 RepID=UPI0027DF001B|nr:TMEM175 family protein [Blastococcus sp. MG754427]